MCRIFFLLLTFTDWLSKETELLFRKHYDKSSDLQRFMGCFSVGGEREARCLPSNLNLFNFVMIINDYYKGYYSLYNTSP